MKTEQIDSRKIQKDPIFKRNIVQLTGRRGLPKQKQWVENLHFSVLILFLSLFISTKTVWNPYHHCVLCLWEKGKPSNPFALLEAGSLCASGQQCMGVQLPLHPHFSVSTGQRLCYPCECEQLAFSNMCLIIFFFNENKKKRDREKKRHTERERDKDSK